MSKELCLFVPDLFWPEPDDQEALQGLCCPHLEKLLARTPLHQMGADSISVHDAETSLLALVDASETLATIRARGDGLSLDKGVVLCADPVHLRFHHEQVVLADPRVFSVSAEEAQSLLAGLNQMFAHIGEFFAPHPERWYVRLHSDHGRFVADLPPLLAVAGRRLVGDALHQGGNPSQADNQRKVRQWQNEIQMWLHAHPLNEARQAAGKPAINGVWFWGTEHSTSKTEANELLGSLTPTTHLYADASHILARGLAASLGITCEALPKQWSNTIASDSLLIWDRLVKPTLYEDAVDWRKQIESFDREWLGPLLTAGKPFHLLIPCIYGSFILSSSDFQGWKFWKKPKPLADFLQGIAQ